MNWRWFFWLKKSVRSFFVVAKTSTQSIALPPMKTSGVEKKAEGSAHSNSKPTSLATRRKRECSWKKVLASAQFKPLTSPLADWGEEAEKFDDAWKARSIHWLILPGGFQTEAGRGGRRGGGKGGHVRTRSSEREKSKSSPLSSQLLGEDMWEMKRWENLRSEELLHVLSDDNQS